MKSKSIWLINQNAVPLKYGIFNRHFDISRELVKKGHNVTLFACSFRPRLHKSPPDHYRYNYEFVDGINVVWIKGLKYEMHDTKRRALNWFLFLWRLYILNKSQFKKPDVIIASSIPPLVFLLGIKFQREFGSVLICDVRDVWPKYLIDNGLFSKSNLFIKLLAYSERKGYEKADFITSAWPRLDIHVSEIINSKFKFKFVPKGITQNISVPLDTLQPIIDASIFAKKFKFVVGYAGSLGPSNCLDTIIDAISDNSILKADICLLIAGGGPLSEYISDVSEKQPNIYYVGSIPKTHIYQFYNICDVLWCGLPNLNLYRFGSALNKWIDYMTASKPIITSYSGYKTMINEAGCGSFVDSENVNQLVKELKIYSGYSKETLRVMGINGKKWLLENRTFDKIAECYEECFEV